MLNTELAESLSRSIGAAATSAAAATVYDDLVVQDLVLARWL